MFIFKMLIQLLSGGYFKKKPSYQSYCHFSPAFKIQYSLPFNNKKFFLPASTV